MSPSIAASRILAAIDGQADRLDRRDDPPGFDPPGPRLPIRPADLSAGFIAELRRDYSPGVPSDEGRTLGDLPEVRAWLDSLHRRKRPDSDG